MKCRKADSVRNNVSGKAAPRPEAKSGVSAFVPLIAEWFVRNLDAEMHRWLVETEGGA